MKTKIAKIIMLAAGFCAAILLLFPWCYAVTYETKDPDPTAQYEEQGIKYEEAQGEYAESEVDRPPAGWYRNPEDFPIPDNWPEWVVKNFVALAGEELPERYASLHKWERPNLQASTKWVDVKASRIKNPIELTAPQSQYFAFFKIDPPDATLEQDFKGNAVIYNIGESSQYKVSAYSENDFLGQFVTAKPTTWIKFIEKKETPGEPLQRMERVIQDGNGKFFWVTAIRQNTITKFHNAYVSKIGPDGKIVFFRRLFAINPGYLTNPDDFYTDIEVDGQAIVVATALETGLGETSTGRLTRHVKTPTWTVTTSCWSNMYRAQAITNCANNQNYVYSINTASSDMYIKVNEDSSRGIWGNGGLSGCSDSTGFNTIYGSTRELITDYTNKLYFSLTWRDDVVASSDSRAYLMLCFDGSETATDGDINWSLSPLTWMEKPRGICMSHDDQHVYMVGDHGKGTVERAANGSSNIAKINSLAGVSEWVIESESSVSLWSIERCDISHKGYIACGEYVDGIGLHYLHLVKYDDDFNIEWSRNFRPGNVDVAGRDAVETFDYGFIAVGGAPTLGDDSEVPYIVKTNRYGESCSQGTPCR